MSSVRVWVETGFSWVRGDGSSIAWPAHCYSIMTQEQATLLIEKRAGNLVTYDDESCDNGACQHVLRPDQLRDIEEARRLDEQWRRERDALAAQREEQAVIDAEKDRIQAIKQERLRARKAAMQAERARPRYEVTDEPDESTCADDPSPRDD